MATQLNIKNDEGRRLAGRVAAATGQNITEAVTDALRRRLRQVGQDQALSDEAMRDREAAFHRLTAGTRSRWNDAFLTIDHGDMPYDEHGLPR